MLPEERFISSLEAGKRHLHIADHLVYTSFPIVKDLKLLLKALEELSLTLINLINSVLQYEYIYKRIQLYKDARANFETFKKVSSRYNITQEQFTKILEILDLADKHKKSSLEFSKSDKIVIMSDSNTMYLDLAKIKSYILETQDILRKISLVIK